MQGSRNMADTWLSIWTQRAQDAEARSTSPSAGDGQSESDAHYYLRIFAYIAGGNSLAALFRSFIFAYAGLRGARVAFVALLDAILRAPVAFFDQNPVGRILNRFSTDTNSIDESIPFLSNIFLAQSFMLLGSVVVIATVVPAILLLVPLLAFVYYKIQSTYRSVSRELRRLDSTTRSPIYAFFSETLTGAPVIRAFGYEHLYERRARAILDRNQCVQFSNLGLGNWLNLRLQCIGCTMLTCVAFLAIFSSLYSFGPLSFLLRPEMIGLAIAYALPLTDNMNGIIGAFTDTEKEIISVERTMEYIEIKSEEEEDELGVIPSQRASLDASHLDEDDDDEESQLRRGDRRVTAVKNEVSVNKQKQNARWCSVSTFAPLPPDSSQSHCNLDRSVVLAFFLLLDLRQHLCERSSSTRLTHILTRMSVRRRLYALCCREY